jgi:hypothetical protein
MKSKNPDVNKMNVLEMKIKISILIDPWSVEMIVRLKPLNIASTLAVYGVMV